MAAMLVFTIVSDLTAWVIFALTDYFIGGYSFAHMAVLAEWFIVPMAASAIYRSVTDTKHDAEVSEKALYMVVWFVFGTVSSGLICKAVGAGKWLFDGNFDRFDYLSYACSLVFGFIVYSFAYEVVRFFVDGDFAARRSAGMR